jgi:neutral trehalase
VVVVHPWESGLDNSPPYLDAGSRVQLAYRPQYERLDTLHVAARNRPTNKDYDLFVYLLELMRADDWDQQRYLTRAPLQVQDVLFNSILCRAHADLEWVGAVLGQDTGDIATWREQTTASVNRMLWDDEMGTYWCRDRVSGELMRDDTIAAFGTLYGGIATPERADRLLERLRDPELFAPPHGYPVPTTALNSPYFNPENYWLGPTWISTNWLMYHGVQRVGQEQEATRLRRLTIDLVAEHGFREYFNPITGLPYGADQFSWTAALLIDLARIESEVSPGT